MEAAQKMTWDLQRAKMIDEERFWRQPCCKRSLYQRMLNKSTVAIQKELDLVKFMRRMRLLTYATLAKLNRRQLFIADNLSSMLIRESSDFNDSTSDDGELNEENEPDIEQHSSTILQSEDKTDKRFLKIFQILKKYTELDRQRSILQRSIVKKFSEDEVTNRKIKVYQDQAFKRLKPKQNSKLQAFAHDFMTDKKVQRKKYDKDQVSNYALSQGFGVSEKSPQQVF